MLVLFGVRPASIVVAAVVIYRAISLWVPALIGSLAFLSLRREIGKPLEPDAPGAAGSVALRRPQLVPSRRALRALRRRPRAGRRGQAGSPSRGSRCASSGPERPGQ